MSILLHFIQLPASKTRLSPRIKYGDKYSFNLEYPMFKIDCPYSLSLEEWQESNLKKTNQKRDLDIDLEILR